MSIDLIHLAKQALLSIAFLVLVAWGAWTVWANTMPVVTGIFGDADD